MKKIEFYEKYWLINGQPVTPLSEKEKAYWEYVDGTLEIKKSETPISATITINKKINNDSH